jgi:CubicO group peptidase (beta-lactamase class C family)
MRTQLLAPAGIREDGLGLTRSQQSRLAAGYESDVRQEPISARIVTMNGDYWKLKGNGGMQLSARAMFRWHQALTCRAGMNDALRRLVLHPIVEPAGDLEAGAGTLVSYGYGWAFRTTPDGTPFKLAHSGSDGVFLSVYIWRPYDRVFLYVVSNIGEEAARPTTVALRRLVGDSVQLGDQDVAGRRDPWDCAGGGSS